MADEDGPSYRIEFDFAVHQDSTLVVTGPWTDAIDEVLSSGQVRSLDLNSAKGFHSSDLERLGDWPVESLRILDRSVTDLAPLARVATTLQRLSIYVSVQVPLDLAGFPKLTTLAASWDNIEDSIGGAALLEDLYVGRYSGKNLMPFEHNRKLLRLAFKDRPRIETLDGLSSLSSLEHLAVHRAPMADLAALATSGVSLRELHLTTFRTVTDWSPLSSQRNLRRLDISECGDVDSLAPIADLHELEELWMYGSTRIVDGDLRPLAALPKLREVRIQSRSSYNPPASEIHAICAERSRP